MTSYAGWVPTITGQLSFSLIGLRTGNAGYITANRANNISGKPRRTIVVVKRRVTRDVPVPIRWFHPQRVKTCILLGRTVPGDRPSIANDRVESVTDDIGEVAGQVLVIPYHRDGLLNRLAKRCVKDVTSMVSSLPEDASAEQLFEEVLNRVATSEQAGVRVLRCDYQLYRTGEVRVQTDVGLRPESAQQMYYFVKDCAHRHYHHDHSTDNLLPLTEAPLSDDISWRRHSLWCLTRSVLEARRRDSLKGYKSALGMLAYADAFQALLGKIHRPEGTADKYAIIHGDIGYDFAHTKASLEAKIAEKEFSSGSTRDIVNMLLASALGLIAIWIAAVQINGDVCQAVESEIGCNIYPPEYMAYMVAYVIQKPLATFGVVIMIAMIMFYKALFRSPLILSFKSFVEGWSQATGATISRRVLTTAPSYADAFGAWGAAAVSLFLGALLIMGLWGLHAVIVAALS